MEAIMEFAAHRLALPLVKTLARHCHRLPEHPNWECLEEESLQATGMVQAFPQVPYQNPKWEWSSPRLAAMLGQWLLLSQQVALKGRE